MPRPRPPLPPKDAQSYRHREADLAARPEIGAQAHFKQAKPPTTYRFDSSLAPDLNWDGQNPAREQGEAALARIADCGLRIAELSRQPANPQRDAERDALALEIRNLQSAIRNLSRPFLNWSGKAERLSFDVPTLPLFVHERLSTSAILDTLKGHKRDQQDDFLSALYGSPERSLSDQVLRAYEYRDNWVNRLILGDSLVVMNSLLRFESLGGQVQMIYVDPPYGVKFGSNFQPFIRKRDVAHNDDADMTREPEMVQAYRDTWELGLHSYLTYLRDRLLLARELLAPSGSIFVQISDENVHHVREVMDEVFGAENGVCTIIVAKTSSGTGNYLATTADYLLWFAKDIERLKFRQPYADKTQEAGGAEFYDRVELSDGTRRAMTSAEKSDPRLLPAGCKIYRLDNLCSQSIGRDKGEGSACWFPVELNGKEYRPNIRLRWKTNEEGMAKLKAARRLEARENSLSYVRYLQDFPVVALSNLWGDLRWGYDAGEKIYVVQTNLRIVQRCLLMTTDPGDLVLDPTCGSGTTAYVAEQWGRRWITCDTSRVPLALARQRLLTATFDYYQINPVGGVPSRGETDPSRVAPVGPVPSPGGPALGASTAAGSGDPAYTTLPNSPANGFVYKRRQNQKGEEVGGIVPHITLKSIANHEPPAEEVLVDRPEVLRSVVRVTGPFSFEATIPTAEGLDEERGVHAASPSEITGRSSSAKAAGESTLKRPEGRAPGEPHENYVQRMLEVLRRAPVLRLPGNQTVTLKNIRLPAKTLALSAEAILECGDLSPLSAGDLSPSKSDARPSTSRALHAPSPGDKSPGGKSADKSAHSKAVAILFGPENGPLSERLVREAWDEAGLKHYARLYVIGFAIDPKARQFIDSAGQIGIPCTYLQATMDLQMGDLLKNMRSSQIFSVCGLPDVAVRPVAAGVSRRTSSSAKSQRALTSAATHDQQWQAELLGLDTFDPVTMEADHLKAADVPAWFLDTDYNGMVFRVRQAFFPRTGAWENLKKALKVEFEDTVWDHLAGTTSAPFPAGEHNQIAVKVIDPRGNELLVVKKLEETK